MSNTNKPPTHSAYAVSGYDGERPVWHLIGTASAHDDGEGFTLELDRMPNIVIRTLRDETAPAHQPEAITEFA